MHAESRERRGHYPAKEDLSRALDWHQTWPAALVYHPVQMHGFAVMVWEKHSWKVAGFEIPRRFLKWPRGCVPCCVDLGCFVNEKAHTPALCMSCQTRVCAEICRARGCCWQLRVTADVPNTVRCRGLAKFHAAPQSARSGMLMSGEQILGCGVLKASLNE